MERLVLPRLALVSLAAAAVVWDTPEVHATGFFVNQQSVQGRGRVDAGNSAAADDLGTIFFNPAALTDIWRPNTSGDWRYSIGLQLIVPRSTQTNAGTQASVPAFGATFDIDGQRSHNPTDPTPVPNIYVAHKLADGKAAIGAGINFPFGLAIKSPADWFGRYDAIEAALTTLNLTFVGAYKTDIPGLSVGGGVDVQYAKTKLVTAIPYPLAPGGPSAATDGRVETTGHAWTPGYNLGLHYVFPDGNTKLGVHYRSRMKHHIKGVAGFSNLLPPFDSINTTFGARADVDLPAVATAGIWRQVTDTPFAVMAELEWYDWSTFHDIRTRFDGLPDSVRLTNYRDTFAIAVGTDYRMNDALTLRGGVKFDRTPTRDGFRDTTVPDSNRLWLGLGASWRRSETSRVDFAFNHVFFKDTTVDTTRTFFDGTPAATSVRTRADVSAVVNTIAVDFRWSF